MPVNTLNPVKTIVWFFVIVCPLGLLTGCWKGTSVLPKTKEEFAEAFKKAYASNDIVALEKLVKWGDCSERVRLITQKALTSFAGQNTVDLVTFAAYESVRSRVEDGKRVHFTLEPVYWIVIETSGDGGRLKYRIEGAIGYENGR